MKKHVLWVILGLFVILIIYFIPKKDALTIYTNDLNVITVKIDGAIRKPGYYTLPKGSTMFELINLAGGLKENAEVNDISYLEKLKKNSYLIPYITDVNVPTAYEYNLNTIGFQELIQLPNITETRAINILLYRQEHNQFHSIDELLQVKGIGDATFEKIKHYFII